MKTNKQFMTWIAGRLNLTLDELCFNYLTDDDFKTYLDTFLDDVNKRRVKNGYEKGVVNFGLISSL